MTTTECYPLDYHTRNYLPWSHPLTTFTARLPCPLPPPPSAAAAFRRRRLPPPTTAADDRRRRPHMLPLAGGLAPLTVSPPTLPGAPRHVLDQGDVRIDEAQLRKTHVAAYLPALAAGALSVMVSYSSYASPHPNP